MLDSQAILYGSGRYLCLEILEGKGNEQQDFLGRRYGRQNFLCLNKYDSTDHETPKRWKSLETWTKDNWQTLRSMGLRLSSRRYWMIKATKPSSRLQGERSMVQQPLEGAGGGDLATRRTTRMNHQSWNRRQTWRRSYWTQAMKLWPCKKTE